MKCLFATDLHGNVEKYEKLFHEIQERLPSVVLLGGDLTPHLSLITKYKGNLVDSFLMEYVGARLLELKNRMSDKFPQILAILGNDDPGAEEENINKLHKKGLLKYIHDDCAYYRGYDFYGYAFVPPTPFQLKDWERYDVSRYVDPGCISPEEGVRTVYKSVNQVRYATIKADLDKLASDMNPEHSIFLFHSPPYKTKLDRTALDGKFIDHVPLDVHTGSIALRRFIASKQPLLTLHGHIHESTELTGSWRDKIGETHCFNAAHQGNELSIIEFDPENLDAAERVLI